MKRTVMSRCLILAQFLILQVDSSSTGRLRVKTISNISADPSSSATTTPEEKVLANAICPTNLLAASSVVEPTYDTDNSSLKYGPVKVMSTTHLERKNNSSSEEEIVDVDGFHVRGDPPTLNTSKLGEVKFFKIKRPKKFILGKRGNSTKNVERGKESQENDNSAVMVRKYGVKLRPGEMMDNAFTTKNKTLARQTNFTSFAHPTASSRNQKLFSAKIRSSSEGKDSSAQTIPFRIVVKPILENSSSHEIINLSNTPKNRIISSFNSDSGDPGRLYDYVISNRPAHNIIIDPNTTSAIGNAEMSAMNDRLAADSRLLVVPDQATNTLDVGQEVDPHRIDWTSRIFGQGRELAQRQEQEHRDTYGPDSYSNHRSPRHDTINIARNEHNNEQVAEFQKNPSLRIPRHQQQKLEVEDIASNSSEPMKEGIREVITTERTRTRYGWRVKKRNKKVSDDAQQESEKKSQKVNNAMEDPTAHNTMVFPAVHTEKPVESLQYAGKTESLKPQKFRRVLPHRFMKPDVKEQEPDQQENQTDKVSPSDQLKEQTENEGVEESEGQQKKVAQVHEEGSGSREQSEKHHSEGEKVSKGYDSHHKDEKVEKGHHDAEDHKGQYDNDKGLKEENEEENGHYEQDDEEEAGEKKTEHHQHEDYKKGHSTRGGHVVHKKDEYEKKTEFFDEGDDGGEGEKFGEFYEDHEGKKGGHHKYHHVEGSDDSDDKHKKGSYMKGHKHSEDTGRHEKEGKDSHYEHKQSYGKKSADENDKRFHFKSGKKEMPVKSGGQVNIQQHNHSPYYREVEPQLHRNNQNDEVDENNDENENLESEDDEEDVEGTQGANYSEEIQDMNNPKYEEDDYNKSKLVKDPYQLHNINNRLRASYNEQKLDKTAPEEIMAILKRHPNAQYYHKNGPTSYINYRGMTSQQLPSPVQYNEFIPSGPNPERDESAEVLENPYEVITIKPTLQQQRIHQLRIKDASLMTNFNKHHHPMTVFSPLTKAIKTSTPIVSPGNYASSQYKIPIRIIPETPRGRPRRYDVVEAVAEETQLLEDHSYHVKSDFVPISITTGPM